jgi:hypothetical protein
LPLWVNAALSVKRTLGLPLDGGSHVDALKRVLERRLLLAQQNL